jgi:hypothetical protein
VCMSTIEGAMFGGLDSSFPDVEDYGQSRLFLFFQLCVSTISKSDTAMKTVRK